MFATAASLVRWLQPELYLLTCPSQEPKSYV